LQAGARRLVFGAPEGYDARLLAAWAREGDRIVVHVARDDARLARLHGLIAFFDPELSVIDLPAWDCLPYDRASPHGDIVARRIAALSRLATNPRPPTIVITTISALLQRVPPRTSFAEATLSLAEGAELSGGALQTYFSRYGYHRAENVREPGEYAVRGGLIDIFPAGIDRPVRVDLFGDRVEGIRFFDPVSQRSAEKCDRIDLQPVSEVALDPDSITRFRVAYRELAGRAVDDDPLYEAVSAGHRHPGIEHWLPLFQDRLETVFDFLAEATIVLDPQADEACAARLQLIAEYYDARRERRFEGDDAYHPVAPESLYLTAREWEQRLAGHPVLGLSAFEQPAAADAGARAGRDFADVRQQGGGVYEAVVDHVSAARGNGRRALIAAYSAGSRDRLVANLQEHGAENLATVDTWDPGADTVQVAVLPLERGFESDDLIALSEQDILGDRMARIGRGRVKPEDVIRDASILAVGDLVVHVEHGVGRYDGLVAVEVENAPHDCLRLIYADGDKLFLPVENLDALSRFGSAESAGTLDKLGGTGWQARKARVKGRLKDIAAGLIEMAARRTTQRLDAVRVDNTAYDEFCARFPYPETDDQQRSIADVLSDLANGKPMDRLVCGDVGFGKTEVALRAAFATAMSGQQVAVVVPTTLLARQHFQTFRDRFAGFPVRIAQLSRLVAAKDAAAVRDGLANGKIDIVVGTHALLGKSVEFARLGLVVVDEEQHFGVKQKERLKELQAGVHVLTLTATPIPRTLQLALTGVREMSLIASPPVDRLAVRTFVMPFDPVIVREAILREQFRGGQTFYVCPRIDDLPRVEERLEDLVPEARVVIAHGQMPPTALEAAVSAFYEGAYDVLLATNIIESGLDLPRVNTLVVHRADMFGLAQLYQIRGRVGRSKVRAYAYLTTPAGRLLKGPAEKRLGVMQTLDTLGAGFTLASYDLDIRGAGNLLGEEQSGHIREVGIELYQQMLEDAVAEAKAETGEGAGLPAEDWSPQITIGMPVLIPEAYIPDLGLRLSLYRRLANLRDDAQIDAMAAEMVDRFGPLPEEVQNLLRIVGIKTLCRAAGVEKVDAGPKGAILSFHNDSFARPEALVGFIGEQAGVVKLRPDMKLVYRRNWDQVENRVDGVVDLMKRLARMAEAA